MGQLSTDFFDQQNDAIKRTKLFFILYVIGLIITVSVAFVPMMLLLGPLILYIKFCFNYDNSLNTAISYDSLFRLFFDFGFSDPFVLSTVFLLTLIAVLGVSLFKLRKIRTGGGDAVLKSYDGREIRYPGSNIYERRLINVIDEMSIASGVPSPRIYVLDGQLGINAFAAGISIYESAIGISEGCITRLSRDELQAVIAHEFSHIKHGDMKLNITLIGMLFGLQFLVLFGKKLIYLGTNKSTIGKTKARHYSGVVSISLLAGATMSLVGSIGVFNARLIKAAISRQREFLADASSVQYTRNPSGIVGALKKIAGYTHGSNIEHLRSEEVSHMCFSSCFKSTYFKKFLSTHPPLLERINKFEPNFLPPKNKINLPILKINQKEDFLVSNFGREVTESEKVNYKLSKNTTASFRVGQYGLLSITAEELIDSVGSSAQRHLEIAKKLLFEIPEEIQLIRHTKAGVISILLLMFISNNDYLIKERQIQLIKNNIPPDVYKVFISLYNKIDKVKLSHRLVLLDVISPILRSLQSDQKVNLRSLVIKLTKADGEISLYEYALVQNLLLLMNGKLISSRDKAEEYMISMDQALEIILSTVIGSSHTTDEFKNLSVLTRFSKNIFNYAKQPYIQFSNKNIRYRDFRNISLKEFHTCLIILKNSSPILKKTILMSIARAVAADGEISVEEAELFRVIAGALECPIPPILSTFHV